MVYERLNNFVFIIDVVTVFYLFIFQVINPLKRCIIYFYEFFWLFVLFAKEASVIIFNLSLSLNLNFNMRVLKR